MIGSHHNSKYVINLWR